MKKYDWQEIWLSRNCPYRCTFCYNGGDLMEFDIPKIKSNYVKILDPAFLSKKNIIDVINHLGSLKFNNKVIYYELVQGINYKDLTQYIADALKKSRFINIRFAWDNEFNKNYMYKIRDCVMQLKNAGYNKNLLSCYILYNWKISFIDCMKKIDLLKIWGIKVNDCCFDGQTSPNFKPKYWELIELQTFRKSCRKHNQLVRFKIDPELK